MRIRPLVIAGTFIILLWVVSTFYLSFDNFKSYLPIINDTVGSFNFKEFASAFQCQHPEWCDTYFNDTEEVQQYLYDLQHPKDCSTARFIVMPSEYYSGMGSTIHAKTWFMGIGVTENRTFILPDNANWIFGVPCNPPSFECYFEPITNCKLSLHAPDWGSAPLFTKMGEHADTRVVKLYDTPIFHQPGGFHSVTYVPPRFSKDYFWWHSMLIKYMLRPNNRTKTLVLEEQKRIFPNGTVPHPLLSMYVRHGDKWREAKLHGFSDYMDVVKNISTIRPIKHIYLGTDDPSVIEEATTNPAYKNYTFYYINTRIRHNGSPLEASGRGEMEELVRVSIVDLFLQIQGDVYVCTRTSNWCRLIDEIRKADGKARIPFFSPEPPQDLFYENK